MASWVPLSRLTISFTASRMPTYNNMLFTSSTPSFTEPCRGNDRSTITIKCRFPGVLFGITPKRLEWIPCRVAGLKGPATLPWQHSSAKYSSTTSGFSLTEGMFVVADGRISTLRPSKLILKPSLIPLTRYDLKHWSGLADRALSHCLHHRGVFTCCNCGNAIFLPEQRVSILSRSSMYRYASPPPA